MTPCPICNRETRPYLGGLFDDRYGYPGRFDLFQCSSCGHVSSEYRPGGKEIAALYSSYYPRRNFESAGWKPAPVASGFGAWLNGLKAGAHAWVPRLVRVLDVGAGAGEAVGYHASRGCDAHGVDPDQNVERIAREHGLQMKIGVFERGLYQPSTFDYVTMDQVIEHFSDPVGVMRAASDVLVTGGHLVMTTPNYKSVGARLFGRRWINWHIPYHIQFFTKKSMQEAASRSGFELVEVRSVTHSAWALYQLIHTFTRPREGKISHFWSVGQPRPLFVKGVMAIALVIHALKITHAMTRLLDWMNMGDNLVFICRKA